MKFILAFLSISLGSFAQFLLKIGVNSIQKNSVNLNQVLKSTLVNTHIWLGLICYGLSMIFWLFVLSKMELSKAYPLVSIGYIFTLILGFFFLGETIDIIKISGITLIIIGVILLTK